MTYGDFKDEGGAMGAAETTRQIKALWKSNEEIRGDMKSFRVELVEQGKVLTKIDNNVDRLANAIMMVPPKERCVEYGMRIKALEETVEDLDDKKQCEGCKNEPNITALTTKDADKESRMRVLEQKMWMSVGALAVLQVAIGVILKLTGK
jgi:hypothetical protein